MEILKFLVQVLFWSGAAALAITMYHLQKFNEAWFRYVGTRWIHEPFALFFSSNDLSEDCRGHRRKLFRAMLICFACWAPVVLLIVAFGERMPSKGTSHGNAAVIWLPHPV